MSGATEQLELFAGEWCQRWNERRASWRRTSEGGFDARRYAVVPLDESPARAFITRHHYSAAYPAASLRYGLFAVASGRLLGVAVLGVPMQAKVLTGPFPGLEPYRESLELSRLVLLDEVPANAESWFVARAFAAAAQHGVRGVVMFSDPLPRRLAGEVTMPGHVGTIYQALGCTYTGRGTARTLTMLPDGSVLPARSAQKIRQGERGADGVVRRLVKLGAPDPADSRELAPAEWLARALTEVGARQVRHQGNHRYVLAIGDRGARRRTAIGLEAKPFPKMADLAPADV